MIVLIRYEEKLNEYLEKIPLDDSKSYIHQMRERLLSSKYKNIFNNAYFVKYDEEIVGYLYISSIRNDDVFLEYYIFDNYRNKGIATNLLIFISEYLFDNFNIKNLCLDIDPSNIASTKVALNNNFDSEEDYVSGKIIYKKYNINYINKRKR